MLRIRLLPLVLTSSVRDLRARPTVRLRRVLLARQAGMTDQYNDYIKNTPRRSTRTREGRRLREVVTVTPSQMGTSARSPTGRTSDLQAEESRRRRSARQGLDAATLASCRTRISASATANDRRRCATSSARKSGPHSDRTVMTEIAWLSACSAPLPSTRKRRRRIASKRRRRRSPTATTGPRPSRC